MGSVNDNIRDVKRAYRKTSFQTGYAVAGDSVEATPVPQHTYSTTTHQPTSVVQVLMLEHIYVEMVMMALKPFTQQERIKFLTWLAILGL